MFNWRLRLLILTVAAVSVLLPVVTAQAAYTITGDTVIIPEGRIRGPLFVAGKDVVIKADVDGDVFATGQNITVSGKVDGDLLAGAQTISVDGKVSGDVRCAAGEVVLNGTVGRSLTAFAGTVRLTGGSRVNQDTLVLSGENDFLGVVGRQVLCSCNSFRLSGPVGGDVHFWDVSELNVGPETTIGGSLVYNSPKQAEIAPQAKITGQTKWERREAKARDAAAVDWIAEFIWFAAGVLFWGVLSLIFPMLLGQLGDIVRQSPWLALGMGLLLLIVIPLTALLLMITVVGIPLSLALVMTYISLLYVPKIIVGDAIGRLMIRRFRWEGRICAIFSFLIIFAILILLTKIPVIGGLINIVVTCIAIGAVALSAYRQRHPQLTG